MHTYIYVCVTLEVYIMFSIIHDLKESDNDSQSDIHIKLAVFPIYCTYEFIVNHSHIAMIFYNKIITKLTSAQCM